MFKKLVKTENRPLSSRQSLLGCFFSCYWEDKGDDVKNLERDCYNYLLKLAEELANDFETQYNNMEPFAQWNLPEEIGLEWIDAEGMLNIIKKNNEVSKIVVDILQLIIDNFGLEFEKMNDYIWSFEGMRTSDFWSNQRLLAKKVLETHQSKKTAKTGDGSLSSDELS